MAVCRVVPFCAALVPALALAGAGCRDVTRFSSHGDHFEGAVVRGDFVRAGVDEGTRLCLTLDSNHLQDAPGTISTSDGRFTGERLRPIPQFWHDPLSTLSFGEGRVQNAVYVAGPDDVTVFVSLMQSGDVEVRLMRGAPGGATDAGPAPVFAVFPLTRSAGACSF